MNSDGVTTLTAGLMHHYWSNWHELQKSSCFVTDKTPIGLAWITAHFIAWVLTHMHVKCVNKGWIWYRVSTKVWIYGFKNMRILTNLLRLMWWTIVINAIIDPLIPCLSNFLGSNDLFTGSLKRRSARTLTLVAGPLYSVSNGKGEWDWELAVFTNK